jgi:fatty acid desaturase
VTARERAAIVLLVLACVAEVVFGWLGIALLLFGAAVALGGRAQWIRHRGRGVI